MIETSRTFCPQLSHYNRVGKKYKNSSKTSIIHSIYSKYIMLGAWYFMNEFIGSFLFAIGIWAFSRMMDVNLQTVDMFWKHSSVGVSRVQASVSQSGNEEAKAANKFLHWQPQCLKHHHKTQWNANITRQDINSYLYFSHFSSRILRIEDPPHSLILTPSVLE